MAEIKKEHVWAIFLPAKKKIVLFGKGKDLERLKIAGEGNYLCVRKAFGQVFPVGRYPILGLPIEVEPQSIDPDISHKFFKFALTVSDQPAKEECDPPFEGEGSVSVTIISGMTPIPLPNIPVQTQP